MRRFLSPRDLAEAVGVSESSLKRWADEGLLEVTRTAGGHRRIALREAVRYLRKARLPLLKPELLGLPDLTAAPALDPDQSGADQALVMALTTGRAEIARGIVLSLYLSGRSVADLCDGPLVTVMRQVGDLWRHGPEGIFIEHRAVDICAQCLRQLGNVFPPPGERAPVALGGALEGDPYALPSLMVATVLAGAGWRAVNLGPNLPAAALRAAIEEHQPALVWLSCSVEQVWTEHAREIRGTLQELVPTGVQVLGGGRAWKPQALETGGRFTFAGSMAEVGAFVEGLKASGNV